MAGSSISSPTNLLFLSLSFTPFPLFFSFFFFFLFFFYFLINLCLFLIIFTHVLLYRLIVLKLHQEQVAQQTFVPKPHSCVMKFSLSLSLSHCLTPLGLLALSLNFITARAAGSRLAVPA